MEPSRLEPTRVARSGMTAPDFSRNSFGRQFGF
jgi:hypothetical protein